VASTTIDAAEDDGGDAGMTIALEATGLVKEFPGVRALGGVNLTLQQGAIHALLGENGAGKSTLVKILTGVYRADQGELRLNGAVSNFQSPLQAAHAGIGVVHQERNVVPAFTVAENITLQDPPRRKGIIDRDQQRSIAAKALATLGVDIDLNARVGDLSVAQVQLVEIGKALSYRTSVLLLDEPTASLTGSEAEKLFEVLHRLREQGTAIVFVSHKLEEVFAVCDTVTVLRDGASVLESAPLGTYSTRQIVDLMVGRQLAERPVRHRAVDRSGTPALRLDNVSTALGHRGVNFEVYAGEVHGLYGLVGAGRSELARCLLGLNVVTGGQVVLDGTPRSIRNMGEALHRYRIGYVTEDRKEEGLFLELPVRHNIAVTVWRRIVRGIRGVSRRAEDDVASTYVQSLGIRVASTAQLAGTLSGGNQQKVSLSKWLAADTRLLMIDEPTVGVDVRTKADFHELILDLADRGVAIVLISSDLPEMVALADRVSVMSDYRIVGTIDNKKDYPIMSRQIMDAIHETVHAVA